MSRLPFWRARAAQILCATLAAASIGCEKRRTDAPAPLTLVECAVKGAEDKVKCGSLEVPESWEQPDGRKISLKIVVVPAAKPTGLAPLFDFAGGPGMAVTDGAAFYLTVGAANRATRDIVLVDQRGTGGSAPLRCAELEAASPLTRMYPVDRVRVCREALAKDHDLAQYTTLAAARDIDAVRAAIGAEKIDLFGLSYGTKLAQAYIREFPSHVRSAVLAGSAPMDLKTPLYHARNSENALRLIFTNCAADADCAAVYPSLEDDWAAIVARFEAGPVAMATPDGDLMVERGPFMETFRALLTTEGGQRRAPKLIRAVATGDFAPFVKATTSGPRGFIAEGLYLSVECAEGSALIDPAEIDAAKADTFLDRYRIDEQLGACAEWPIAEISPEFAEPVTSDVPTLIIAGGRDHVTPKDYAMRIAEGFSNSRVILIEELAHVADAISNIECFDNMALAFYEGADPDAVDASCIAEMKAPAFELP